MGVKPASASVGRSSIFSKARPPALGSGASSRVSARDSSTTRLRYFVLSSSVIEGVPHGSILDVGYVPERVVDDFSHQLRLHDVVNASDSQNGLQQLGPAEIGLLIDLFRFEREARQMVERFRGRNGFFFFLHVSLLVRKQLFTGQSEQVRFGLLDPGGLV